MSATPELPPRLRRSPVEPSSSLSTPSPPRADTIVCDQYASEMLSGSAGGTLGMQLGSSGTVWHASYSSGSSESVVGAARMVMRSAESSSIHSAE